MYIKAREKERAALARVLAEIKIYARCVFALKIIYMRRMMTMRRWMGYCEGYILAVNLMRGWIDWGMRM